MPREVDVTGDRCYKKMNGEEISAFSVYSTSKKPKLLNSNNTSKKKSKKKKKLRVNGTSKSTNSTNKLEISSHNNKVKTVPNNVKIMKKMSRSQFIEEMLQKTRESIFKDCSVTPSADNVFFSKNGLPDEYPSNEISGQSSDPISKPKKSKKKKIKINGERSSELKESKKKENKSDNECTSNEISKESSSLTSKPKKSQKRKLESNEEKNSEFPESKKKKQKKSDGSLFFIKNSNEKINFNSVQNTSEAIKKPSKKNHSQGSVETRSKLPDIVNSDSVKIGEEVFAWLLNPLSLSEFFETCWEQKPLHIKHNNSEYFKCLCTLEDFKTMLRDHDLYFTKNIDITSYVNGERTTENPEGKAKPAIVWDFFKRGRSIRLLNPQTFIPNIRVLNTNLQEFFHCFVGANIYLTPAGTQGFAPHYDDIEAFVLQLEGEKHWKLYNPRSPEEVLPRESSKNFKEDEIGEPILEVTLQPGDVLYFPRGFIHQAKCLPHVHSLHVTVSCYQKNSWADLLEKVLPVALQTAIVNNVEFRKGLPIGYLNSLGLVYCDHDSVQRQEIKKKFSDLFSKILDYCPLDAGVDQLGANFVYDALPPSLTKEEKDHGADRNSKLECFKKVLIGCKKKNLNLKLVRATSVRLVSEEEETLLYYTTDNSLVYHEQETCCTVVPAEWAQAIEHLIRSYPEFVSMNELCVSNALNKPGKWRKIVEFVYFLWQKGLLLFDRPLKELYN